MIDRLLILDTKCARHGVKYDIVFGRDALVKGSDGHQATRPTAGLCKEVRLQAGDADIPPACKFSRRVVGGIGERCQICPGLRERALER